MTTDPRPHGAVGPGHRRTGRRTLRCLAVMALLASTAGAACSTGDDGPPGDPPAADSADSADPAGAGLLAAATAGDAVRVGSLLEGGASLEATDGNGRTPLIAASYGGHVETARVLIEAGADVNRQDDTRQSAYLIATSEIGPEAGLALLRLALAHGADVRSLDRFNGTGLIRAAHRGYVDIIGELLGTDIDVDHVNGLGWTALLEAIILGPGGPDHTQVVGRLLQAGADPDRADGEGVTPLAHAEARGFIAIAELLRAAGAHRGP